MAMEKITNDQFQWGFATVARPLEMKMEVLMLTSQWKKEKLTFFAG